MSVDFNKIAETYFDEIVETASQMIRRESISGNEKAMAEYTIEKMKELGYDEVRVDRAGSVIGVMKGTGNGKSCMFNCHLDVVDEGDITKWKYPPYEGVVAEGALWGRGASDTKGTFAIQVYTPYILKKEGLLPKGDLIVTGVVHEESSGLGSMILTRDGFRADYAVVGEATENDLATSCRGRIGIEVTINGKSCHASSPQLGVNPMEYLGRFLLALKDFELVKDPIFGSSSLTPTRIESSEKMRNTIPSWVCLSIDYRSVPAESNEEILAKVRAIAESCLTDGITVTVTPYEFDVHCYNGLVEKGMQGEPPYGVDEDSEIVTLSKEALKEAYGHDVQTKPWAFATDSGHYTAVGVPVIGFSPAEIKFCHTAEDRIDLEMLKKGIAGNLAIAKKLADQPK